MSAMQWGGDPPGQGRASLGLPANEQIHEVPALVTDVRDAGAGCVRLTVQAPAIAGSCRPGQFVMVKCAEGQDPLLPRPFTIYQADEGGGLQLLVRSVGRGSRWLTQRRVGECLHLTGPLGHGFTISPNLRLAVLVAGGTGAAALGLLAAELHRRGIPALPSAGPRGAAARSAAPGRDGLSVLIGAHTREECVGVDDFCGLCGDEGVRVWITRRGLEEELAQVASHVAGSGYTEDQVQIFAAGPLGMLRRVAEFAAAQGLPCQVSVETRMACGVGVCQSCICSAAEGDAYLLVCKDGPVFDSRAVRL